MPISGPLTTVDKAVFHPWWNQSEMICVSHHLWKLPTMICLVGHSRILQIFKGFKKTYSKNLLIQTKNFIDMAITPSCPTKALNWLPQGTEHQMRELSRPTDENAQFTTWGGSDLDGQSSLFHFSTLREALQKENKSLHIAPSTVQLESHICKRKEKSVS